MIPASDTHLPSNPRSSVSVVASYPFDPGARPNFAHKLGQRLQRARQEQPTKEPSATNPPQADLCEQPAQVCGMVAAVVPEEQIVAGVERLPRGHAHQDHFPAP